MINRIITWSLEHRAAVLLVAILALVWSIVALRTLPIDAIPDLADVQVIVRTPFPGQAAQVVEDQVTYPLATALLAVPGARAVRGYSFFGDSFIYVIFDEGTDAYWARSRVTEYLAEAGDRLPSGARPRLGPDASSVGWVYQYTLIDRTGQHDLHTLRGLQDWLVTYELGAIPGVAEVATVGGHVKQYQVELDPDLMRQQNATVDGVRRSIEAANGEAGGSVLELGEAEYLVRTRGYISTVEDLAHAFYIDSSEANRYLMLDNLGEIRIGPAGRSGLSDLDGAGEVVGGIVVMRAGQNALAVIDAVKARLAALKASLPEGVEIVEVYNRSDLIRGAVNNLRVRLIEEMVLVTLVCAVFLLRLRSAAVVLITLPVSVGLTLIAMRAFGINADLMTLGGIALAIGAMVDATIVMLENVHRRLAGSPPEERGARLRAGLLEVGPPLFFSLLIITLAFLPVFVLEGQEGRMFGPLVYTKTFAMLAAALVSITLTPVLVALFVRGSIRRETENPVVMALIRLYRPVIGFALARPVVTLVITVALALTMLWPWFGWWPVQRLGTEFMPRIDEGDLLYMPTTYPGISIGKARELLQQTDRMILTVPEVEHVFGKAGRSDSATDPAPLNMLETTIQLKPREQWREGVELSDIVAELDQRLNLPGLTNAWLMPIEARIDMLATGIRTPIGVKISGPDLSTIEQIGRRVEQVVQSFPEVRSVYAERVQAARYLEITVDRDAAAQQQLSVADIQQVVELAVGGQVVSQAVEGRERYPIVVRYPRELRDSPEALRNLPLFNGLGRPQIPLGEVASVEIKEGPDMIRSENGRLSGWVYIDAATRDLQGLVERAREAVSREVEVPAGYTLAWSGRYEYLERARERMRLIVPTTIAIIAVLLLLTFGSVARVVMVLTAVPLALVGAIWILALLDYQLSVATAVGIIALLGVAAEFGIVMLVYLDQAVAARRPRTLEELREAIIDGAVLRVRPKAMTVFVVLAGLLPIVFGQGVGAEAMQRIAAPMFGGMITAPLVSMVVIPVLYWLWQRRCLPKPPQAA